MKKIISLSIFLLSVSQLTAQNYYMPSPQGYGAGTTGGGSVTPVTVTNYTALKAALTATDLANSVILVSGIIDCSYTSVTLNNKTIIGLPGARLRNLQPITLSSATVTAAAASAASANVSGILNIKPGSSNVIIRNLIFESVGAYDANGRDNLTNEGTGIWVDHCEFQDGMDGNFDNKGKADNVTVSWCKFTYLKAPTAGGVGGTADHRFTNIIGSNATDAPLDGHFSITFQNCYWADGCKERMPRARNSELHLLNCYYNTTVSGSVAIGLGGGANNTTCYVENTDFSRIGTVYKSYVSSDGGAVGITFVGCLNGVTDVGTLLPVAKPTYTYSSFPATDVAQYITNTSCGAGATLQVTTDGVISSSCDALTLKDELSDLGIKYYPSEIENKFNIDFPDNHNGLVLISIFAINGQKVLSYSKNIQANENIELNMENLKKGVYLCKIQIGGKTGTCKLIKK